MNDRCDIHPCSCSPNSEYKMRVEQHSPVTRVSRESKPASQYESAKQFYRGSKYNQVDYMHENNGRNKSKVVLGNYPSRDLFQSKKVWEPTDSLKKHHYSNSDSGVILRSTEVQEAQPDLIKSSIGEVIDSGENDYNDCNSKHLIRMDAGCQNDFQVKGESSCSSKEIASEESGICATGGSVLNNNSYDPTQSSTFSFDNCSSYLSEGDNNMLSNPDNQESSTISTASPGVKSKYSISVISSSFNNELFPSKSSFMSSSSNKWFDAIPTPKSLLVCWPSWIWLT